MDVGHWHHLAAQLHLQLFGTAHHHRDWDGWHQQAALAHSHRNFGAGFQCDRAQFQIAPVCNAQMFNQPHPKSDQVAELSVALSLQGAGDSHRYPHMDDRGGIGPLEIQPFRQVNGIGHFDGHVQVKGATDLEIRAGLTAGVDAPVTGAAGQAGQRVVEAVAMFIQAVVAQRSAA